MSYKWNYTVCTFGCLTYFPQYCIFRFIQILHVIVHPFPLLYEIMYIPLFIHSTVNGRLCNFPFLATIKSGAMNILIHVCMSYTYIYIRTHISVGYKSRSRISGSLGMGMLSFGGYCHKFFKVVVIIYTSSSSIWEFWLPCIHQLLNFSPFFTYSFL